MASPNHAPPRHWAGNAHERTGASRGRNRRRRQGKGRTVGIVTVVALLVVAGLGAWTWKNDGYLFGIATPLAAPDYDGPGGEEIRVEIPAGAVGAGIGQVLVQNDVVASLDAFKRAYRSNPDAVGIQPGTHTLQVRMSAQAAVAALARNQIDRGGLTIPEGYVVDQVKQAMIDAGWPEKKTNKAFENIGDHLPKQAGGDAEGWLFPQTYDVDPEQDPPAEILASMVDMTVSQLQDAGAPKDQWQDVLIRASLIEREARLDKDRPMMAAAIRNRLAADEWLGIDASLLYGLGRTSGGLTSAELADSSNPYNLSVQGHKGLPPTPIAAPGRESIDAVLHPADDTDVFYWCTVNLETGETKFAETQAGHDQNVAQLHAWLADNPDWNE